MRIDGNLVAKSSPTFVILWTVACQVPLSMEFPRQEYWSGLPFPSPGDLPNPGIGPFLLHCRQILYHPSHQGSPKMGRCGNSQSLETDLQNLDKVESRTEQNSNIPSDIP